MLKVETKSRSLTQCYYILITVLHMYHQIISEVSRITNTVQLSGVLNSTNNDGSKSLESSTKLWDLSHTCKWIRPTYTTGPLVILYKLNEQRIKNCRSWFLVHEWCNLLLVVFIKRFPQCPSNPRKKLFSSCSWTDWGVKISWTGRARLKGNV